MLCLRVIPANCRDASLNVPAPVQARRHFSNAAQTHIFEMRFRAGPAGYPMRLIWDMTAIKNMCDSAVLIDLYGGALYRVRMDRQDSLTVTRTGIHWTKYAGNPIVSLGSTSEWDGRSLGSGALIYQDGKFHLWYLGLGYSQTNWQTGNATSVPANAGTFCMMRVQIRTCGLSQSYPNPFKPSTRIKYDLPIDTRVSLKLFSILGQEVATLSGGPFGKRIIIRFLPVNPPLGRGG